MEKDRPFVFIGSSSEGLRVAEAIQELLDTSCEVRLWTQGAFGLSQASLESLLACCGDADFAILVLTGDDILVSRGNASICARDNVLFELGLFMGALGRQRTFFVHDRTASLKLPSDLAGITAAQYTPPTSGDFSNAVGAAASQIKRAIDKLGPRSKIRSLQTASGCDISIDFGRIENCATPDEHGLVVLPANEFFDDDCFFDQRSALGAFATTHCKDGPRAFQDTITTVLAGRVTESVEKEPGVYQDSYGVGTVAFLSQSESLKFNVAAVAVTTKRSGEGLRATPSFVLDAISSISEIVADKRLSTIRLPLLGAGHGGIPPAVSLQCLMIGLAELSRSPGGHHLKKCTITVFQSSPDSSPEISPELIKKVLHGGDV